MTSSKRKVLLWGTYVGLSASIESLWCQRGSEQAAYLATLLFPQVFSTCPNRWLRRCSNYEKALSQFAGMHEGEWRDTTETGQQLFGACIAKPQSLQALNVRVVSNLTNASRLSLPLGTERRRLRVTNLFTIASSAPYVYEQPLQDSYKCRWSATLRA